MRGYHLLAALAVIVYGGQPGSAQQVQSLRGADAVLADAKADNAAAAKPQADDAEKLLREIQSFAKGAGDRAPQESAREWLALFDKLPDQEKAAASGSARDPFLIQWLSKELFASLPGPNVWPELSRQIDARPVPEAKTGAMRAHALRFLGHLLTANQAAQSADAVALRAVLTSKQKASGAKRLLDAFVGTRGEDMADYVLMQAWPLVMFAAQLKGPEAVAEVWLEQAKSGQPDWHGSVDLVALLGEEKARPILEQVVGTVFAQQYVNVPYLSTSPTGRLFKQIVLEQLDKLPKPAWQLVTSPRDKDLYEALAKRFPNDQSPERAQAESMYMVALIAANQLPEALALLKKQLARSATDQARNYGGLLNYTLTNDSDWMNDPAARKALTKYVGTLADEAPTAEIWRQYLTLATASGDLPTMIAALEKHLAGQQNLPAAEQATFSHLLVDALLAGDREDDAVRQMRTRVLDAVKPADAGAAQISAAAKIARVGQLLNKPDWTDLGVRYLVAAVAQGKASDDAASLDAEQQYQHFRSFGSRPDADYQFLVDAGQAAAAEALLARKLATAVRQSRQQESFGGGDTYQTAAALSALVSFYSRQGRHDDVLALADKAPWWGQGDVVGLMSEMQAPTAPIAIARALHAKGRTEEARAVVNANLARSSNDDGPYELLIAMDAQAAIPRLDAQAAANPLQERPLIWKARLLLEAGKLDDAEQTARQAIAIDPSDGEQPHGKRMIVYSVLADVLEQAGGEAKLAEAMIYRRAVQAIRLAEKADDLLALGLANRAIDTYEQATKLFVDAYCVQSRLAVEMAKQGRLDEAAAHYRKAFELMPDSFGRVESHCFGCEGVFTGADSQRIAEEVFEHLAKTRPDKPQVHYLLGYLREEQGRLREALVHFRRAVTLDPDYYNAWQKIASISPKVEAPADDAAALALLRMGNASTPGYSQPPVRDLKAAWDLIAARIAKTPPTPDQAYPLAASREALAEAERKATGQPNMSYQFSKYRRMTEQLIMQGDPSRSPAGTLAAQHPVFVAIEQIFNQSQ